MFAVVAALGAPTAGAQQGLSVDLSDARPAIGGGTFNTAPLLVTGAYRDTILPDETLFYGVALGEGQHVEVVLRALTDDTTFRRAVDRIDLGVYTPVRQIELLSTDPAEGFSSYNPGVSAVEDVANVRGPDVTSEDASSEKVTYRGPGIWYVGLYAAPRTTEGKITKAEIPVGLQINVLGTARAPVPTTLPAQDKAPASPGHPPDQSAASPDSNAGVAFTTVLIVIAAALLVGLALGALVQMRLRSRRAP